MNTGQERDEIFIPFPGSLRSERRNEIGVARTATTNRSMNMIGPRIGRFLQLDELKVMGTKVL